MYQLMAHFVFYLNVNMNWFHYLNRLWDIYNSDEEKHTQLNEFYWVLWRTLSFIRSFNRFAKIRACLFQMGFIWKLNINRNCPL